MVRKAWVGLIRDHKTKVGRIIGKRIGYVMGEEGHGRESQAEG